MVKRIEQHIAVFGESGSGKTVLVSSFFGVMQEPDVTADSLFDLVAEDASVGHRLHQMYLGMKTSARAPLATRHATTAYSFALKMKQHATPSPRIVWHDYPGEWLNASVADRDEAADRMLTFRNLLSSHVALILVDGKKLQDNAGEEERYLKGLFTSMRLMLASLKSEIVANGPLVQFPRIWMLALSKADLLPSVDVVQFRDMVIGAAAGELEALRKTIASMVDDAEALSVGEDFIRLSSARFEPGVIDLTQRVGVDQMLPIATVLPLERIESWVSRKETRLRVVRKLVQSVADVIGPLGPLVQTAAGLLVKRFPRLAVLGTLVLFARSSLQEFVSWGADRLEQEHHAAISKKDHLRATLLGFAQSLNKAVDARILFLSRR